MASCSFLLSLIMVAAVLRSAAGGWWSFNGANSNPATAEYIRSECRVTRYPDVCVASLASYAGSLQAKQSEVVKAAVNVSLLNSRDVSAWAARVSSARGLRKAERAALKDCVENFGDTNDQIRESLAELKHLRSSTFNFQMSNVQTWMSAALTNEDSCLDGFQDVNGRVKLLINRRVQNICMLISNALALVNNFATGGGGY